MWTSFATLDIAIVLAGLAFILRVFRRNSRNAPCPPGPKGLPVIGNLFDMPTEREWLTFAKWGEKYGIIFNMTESSITYCSSFFFIRRYSFSRHPWAAPGRPEFRSDGHQYTR